MTRVCGTGFPDLLSYLQPILINDRLEAVSPQRCIPIEFFGIHIPQFHSSDARIYFPYRMDKLHSKRFLGEVCKSGLFNILEIGLLGNAKQSTQRNYRIAPLVLCMQVCYCLAPAFFLILMLNCSSATFIISSYASALKR